MPTPVIANISLEIESGTLSAIIGKSGCGKSTLLYILSTLDTRYFGDLYIGGTLMNGKTDEYLSAFRNENIGFVFQSQFLLNDLNVLRNISLPLYKKGGIEWQDADYKAIEMLKRVKLEGHYKKKVTELSGGQQQRVAIARSIVCSPQIVFADEPTGNLDTQNTKIIFDLFREIASELNKTVVVVTHDSDFAGVCDRIIAMEDGKIIHKS